MAAAIASGDPGAESDEDAGNPVLVTARDGWDIQWTAYPRPARWRGQPGRLITSESMHEAVAVEDERPLRGSLQGKASRYGRLDAPYLIAVGEEPFSPADVQDHRADPLYGTSAVVVEGPRAGQAARLRDGSWRRGRTWRHTRVSGALFLAGLRPWNATEAVPELWLNPAAGLAVPDRLPHWRVQRVEAVGGQGRLRTDPPAVTPAAFWRDSPGW